MSLLRCAHGKDSRGEARGGEVKRGETSRDGTRRDATRFMSRGVRGGKCGHCAGGGGGGGGGRNGGFDVCAARGEGERATLQVRCGGVRAGWRVGKGAANRRCCGLTDTERIQSAVGLRMDWVYRKERVASLFPLDTENRPSPHTQCSSSLAPSIE